MISSRFAVALLVGVLVAGAVAINRLQDRPERGPGLGGELPRSPDSRPNSSAEPAILPFGLDASGALALPEDARPDYGTFWIGPWTLQWGWKDPDEQLARLRAANVTPAVHLYYWGDGIRPACFDVGCDGKDTAMWRQLAQQTAEHLAGGPAVVFLETEFNKADVAMHEPLDGHLADIATILQANPDLTVVLSFGNWYPTAWPTWDRAAAASDAVGLQAISGLTRNDANHAASLATSAVEGARTLNGLFGKPVWLDDVAVSSWPEPEGLDVQKTALDGFAQSLEDLRAAGVQAIIYRTLYDTPAMDGYYGEAERHFGLAWADGGLKPGGAALLSALHPEATQATQGAASQ
ncbi:MAG: hypothetical protein AABX89_02995 [Candidatus Thermoplasmatota archaeon]